MWFHFFELIWTQDFLCVQNAPFKATSTIFNTFWVHFVFFRHYWFFELNDPEIEKHYKWTLNRLKVGMVSSFHPIACAKMLRGLPQKLDALHVQIGQSLSKYEGFIREIICYKRDFIFWHYLNSIPFVCSKCTIQSHIINFQLFLTSFGIFHAFVDFFWAKGPWNWNALQINSEKVESWHGIIISPT